MLGLKRPGIFVYQTGQEDLKGALFVKATDVALMGRVADP